jgi:hypothetical protein
MLVIRTKNVYHIQRKNRKNQFYKQLVIITFVVGFATLFTDFLVEFFIMIFSCSSSFGEILLIFADMLSVNMRGSIKYIMVTRNEYFISHKLVSI